MSTDSKKYALVKWLENTQFDAKNEWTGRLTSVSHTNIIDFDAEELKTGMEISIFRNGEMWKAQVIIPKTNMNTVDLPPSNHRIRTIVLPIKDKTNIQETRKEISTFQESNDYDELIDNTNNLIGIDQTTTLRASSTITSSQNYDKLNNNHNNNSNNKQTWQFLQSALNDSPLNDYYQQSNSNSNTSQTITSSQQQQQVTSADTINIETILQMQCELLDQQKELKTIEMETIEQLKLLHQNVVNLAKKFDLFEQKLQSQDLTPMQTATTTKIKTTRNSLNKLNQTITPNFHVLDIDDKSLNETNSSALINESINIKDLQQNKTIYTTLPTKGSQGKRNIKLITTQPVNQSLNNTNINTNH